MDEPKEYNEGDIVSNDQGARLQLKGGQWTPINAPSYPQNASPKEMERFLSTPQPGYKAPEQPNPLTSPITNAPGFGISPMDVMTGQQVLPGLIRGARGLLSAPWTRGGRVAQAAAGLGRETNPAIRLAEARGPITQAYHAAESVEAAVPIGGVKATIRRAIAETPNMDEKAVDELLKLESSDLVGNAPNGLAQYKHLVQAEQNLPTDLYNDATNAAMRKVRGAIVDATSAVNPALARANALTAHTTASDKVLRIVNSSKDARSAAVTVDNLLSKDPQTVKALGLNNPVGMEQFRSLIARGAPADTIKAFLQRYGGWILGGAAAGAGGVAVHQMFGGNQQGGGGG